MGKEFFKVSSALKNEIGKELITDNFIAVFELVKNSFDARAETVSIRFEGLRSRDPKIIIADDGKGMDYDDLINKWLFVAYSAKRDNTEDGADYRNKIKTNTPFAGAKGVGRFSCDRLGRYLNLITVADKRDAKIENLFIDWAKFEKDQREEFIKIPVEHSVLSSAPFRMKHGTILEITGFNSSDWKRENLLRLKDRLSKLIRPDLHNAKQQQEFQIVLTVPDEAERDKQEIERAKDLSDDERPGYEYKNTVNGSIRNFVFDELDIRTTRIEALISEDGKEIVTTLSDRGEFIYEIKETNPYELLSNVSITLFFLNPVAKAAFSRRMKVQPVEYGNLFVYKNGFRIHPYGDRGDDSFGIDNRALQGYARYIGLREIIGQIDIQGPNRELRETTSRAGGFVKTSAYQELASLESGFLVKTLRRLEKFVVDVIQWGVGEDVLESLKNSKNKENLIKIISNIYDDKSLISVTYNRNIINLLDQKEERSARRLIRNFKRLANQTNDPQLKKDSNKLQKTLEAALEAKSSAEEEATREREAKKKAKEELEQQISETYFARAVVGTDTKELLSIQHHIHRHSAQHISALLDRLIDAVNKNLSKEKLLEIINQISLANKKIITLSRFVTKATFDTKTEKIKTDLVRFVNEYVVNVYLEFKREAAKNSNLQIRVSNPDEVIFERQFQPIELIIILDNLLNNSFKAKARTVDFVWEQASSSEIILHVIDDGIGIPDKNVDKIFEFRFTTTDGSGLGLYHTKQVIERLGGSIEVNNKLKRGVEFVLRFKK